MAYGLSAEETLISIDAFRDFLEDNTDNLQGVRFCVDFSCLNASPDELKKLDACYVRTPWLRKVEGMYSVMYRMLGYVRFHTMTLLSELAEAAKQ